MKKKKILFLINSLYSGGAEKVLVDTVNSLDKSKFKILISAIEKDKFYILDRGINYEVLSYLSALSNKFLKLIVFPIVFFRLLVQIRRFKPDTIVSFMEVSNFFAIFSKFFFGIKVHITVHINPKIQYSSGFFSVIINYLIKVLYRRANKIIVVSKDIKKTLIEDYGINAKSIEVIYNSINICDIDKKLKQTILSKDERFFSNDSFVFVTIGRLSEQKGHKYFIKAFSKVVSKNKNAKLLIIGEGPLKETLFALVKKLKLENNVFLIGTRKNVFPYLKRSDCFIFPSLWEGFGIVVIEAMYVGLLVLASDCKSGPREIIAPSVSLSSNLQYPYLTNSGVLMPVFDVINSNYCEKIWVKSMLDVIDGKFNCTNIKKRSKYFAMKKNIKHWEKILLR